MHPTPSTSASPAPYRVASASRHTDGPSPSKRRKLAAPQPALNSSSNLDQSGSTSDPQLDTERRASSSRVLNVWSALEDKYARRIDEDDIVDLRSGGLIKDRGVLSSKDGTWDIGCFADPKVAQGNENSAQEDDEDEDEIGVWDSDSVLDHQFNPVHVPPVRELDPGDAEDLRAFLAAEEARKFSQGADDFSEDEDDLDVTGGGNYDTGTDPNLEIDESVVEIEVGSAPALTPTDSDDELAGYDDTVGEGALLWEVGTEMSNCSEPLGAESGAIIKPLPALPRRNQTPAQLRTPPLSRSSMRESNEWKFPRTSPRPLRRPPVELPPSKSRKRSMTWTSSKKKAPSNQHSPDGGIKVMAPLLTAKGREREISLSPTKNLIPEVTLPMPRANTMFRQCEDGMKQLKHDDKPRTPTQPRLISQSEGNRAVEHQKRPQTLPRRSVKSKRAISDESDTDVDVGHDDTKVRRTRERRVSESYAQPVDLSESLSSRRRRHSTSGPLHRPTTSTSLEDSIASSPHHDLRRSPSYHRHPTPSFPLHDFWPPYPPHAHTPVPSFPAFYPPPPNAMRESSVAPASEVQIHIAQAMQSLSYLAFGLPPPLSSAHSSHSLHTPPSSSPPSSMRSYPAPYFPYHTQGHPPWFYPPSPYPYPCPSATHTHPPASSSATSYTMPNSFREPPSSPPDILSSPLTERRKRKRVSFPEDVVRSESESRSETDSDAGDVGDGEKGKGKAKGQVLDTITSNRYSRKDSQESSKCSGSCNRNPSPRRKR